MTRISEPSAPMGALCVARGLRLRGADADPAPDFSLRPGLTLVTGGEGRGKTRLLQALAGRLPVPEVQLWRVPGLRACLPQPQDPAFDGVAARDWLAGQAAGQPAWRAEVAASLATALALDEHLAKPLYMLSTGSRRKLGVVAAAASGAALTLLDGPYAALDARSCRLLDELLTEAAQDTGRAWVVADYEVPRGLAAQAPVSLRVALGD